MSLKENEKIQCERCKGKGHLGPLPVKVDHERYKILCPKCYGLRELDWIENVVGLDKSNTLIILVCMANGLVPDNYVFMFGGTAYFVGSGYFKKDGSEAMLKHVKMNVPFTNEYPGTLDMWRD